jgi:hypothetical protein
MLEACVLIAVLIVLLALLAFCLRLSEAGRAGKTGGARPKILPNPGNKVSQLEGPAGASTGPGAPVLSETRGLVVANHSQKPVWVGTQTVGAYGATAAHRDTQTPDRGWLLEPLSASRITVPRGWRGKIWGRTDCEFDSRGAGACRTGGCGCCMGCLTGPAPPATVAEFALDTPDGNDHFSVSLAQGYNLPMTIVLARAGAQPSAARWGPSSGCVLDLRADCPNAQQVQDRDGHIVGCTGAALETDDRCCRGMYGPRPCGDPSVPRVPCLPTPSAARYKRRCPTAQSYAGDTEHRIYPSRARAEFVVSFHAQPPNAPLTG